MIGEGAFCAYDYSLYTYAQSTLPSATFLSPNDWYISDAPVSSSDLSNTTTAADILGNDACQYGMYKD